ncbi:hypothetical protein [Ruminococcus flavefaciens]|uniref:Uncharacterized protein n=1 Tax=Ruminococcus flavefaciens 007c TaxID=1341157 RepID=W7V241_RUMFL|nr:hypothetical protein [Ruminococcus flavefaciens]EWM54872.1 hypothetical protein RF007C_11070 [Ruminococcus flavefaciens 007c]
MYKELVKKLRRKHTAFYIIIALVVVLFTGGCLAAFIAADLAFNKKLLCVLAGIILIAGCIVEICTYNSRIRSMWSRIGVDSEEEMSSIIENSEPLGQFAETSKLFITEDTIINFQSLKAYRIKDLKKLRKSDHSSDGSNKDYYLKIKLNRVPKMPRKDEMAFSDSIDRKIAYKRILSAYTRITGNDDID